MIDDEKKKQQGKIEKRNFENQLNIQLGKAGEYLVCADLILQGYVAYLSEQGLHYDVVLDVDGRLLRIQVKSTRCPTGTIYPKVSQSKYSPSYVFDIRYGRNGRRKEYTNVVDIFAFVIMDKRLIGYLPVEDVPKGTMRFRDKTINYRDHKRGRYIEDFTIKKALEGLKL